MSKLSIGASLLAVIAAGLALFSFLRPCGLCGICGSSSPSELHAAPAGFAREPADDSAESAPLETITLADFPAAADLPAGPYSTRPRRPVHLAALPSPSAGFLALIAGGTGTPRAQSAASVTYGVRLSVDVAESERDLTERFLLGGDEGGADVMAIGLERFAAVLPMLLPARPKIFLLLAYSRGSIHLVSANAGDVSGLKNASVSYVPGDGGRYFAVWRLLKEGIGPEEVSWIQAKNSADALKALREGRVQAALVQSAAVEGAGEISSSEDGIDEETAEPGEQIEQSEQPESAAGEENGPACESDEEGEEGTSVSEGSPENAPEISARSDMPRSPEKEAAEVKETSTAAAADAGTKTAANVPDKSAETPSGQLFRLASTSDAPFLSPIVLVVREEFAVRYPETMRRLAKAVLAEENSPQEMPMAAARRLRELYPAIENSDVLLSLLSEEPTASLSENRAFFGLSKTPARVQLGEILTSQIRVLNAHGKTLKPQRPQKNLPNAEALVWMDALQTLSEKSIASARAQSRAAQKKGKIREAENLDDKNSEKTSPEAQPPSPLEPSVGPTEESPAPADQAEQPTKTDKSDSAQADQASASQEE